MIARFLASDMKGRLPVLFVVRIHVVGVVAQTGEEGGEGVGEGAGVALEVGFAGEFVAPYVADVVGDFATVFFEADVVAAPVEGEGDEGGGDFVPRPFGGGAAFEGEVGVVGEGLGVADGDEVADFDVGVAAAAGIKEGAGGGAAVVLEVVGFEAVGQGGGEGVFGLGEVVFGEVFFAVVKGGGGGFVLEVLGQAALAQLAGGALVAAADDAVVAGVGVVADVVEAAEFVGQLPGLRFGEVH